VEIRNQDTQTKIVELTAAILVKALGDRFKQGHVGFVDYFLGACIENLTENAFSCIRREAS
jgi:hypothetical protein